MAEIPLPPMMQSVPQHIEPPADLLQAIAHLQSACKAWPTVVSASDISTEATRSVEMVCADAHSLAISAAGFGVVTGAVIGALLYAVLRDLFRGITQPPSVRLAGNLGIYARVVLVSLFVVFILASTASFFEKGPTNPIRVAVGVAVGAVVLRWIVQKVDARFSIPGSKGRHA